MPATTASTTRPGLGVYSFTQAARLIHGDARKLRRWMVGIAPSDRRSNGTNVDRQTGPLWTPQYSTDPTLASRAIGFHDLLELRIVQGLLRHGVPLSVVRQCLGQARSHFHADYPLTAQRFLTDGRTVFLEALTADSQHGLLDLKTLQYAFKEVIKPSLYSGIEYTGHSAVRWFPNPRSRSVVVDPHRAFGKPVLDESGVPTEALVASYRAEGADAAAERVVARFFELPVKELRAAVRFEAQWLAA